MTEILNMEGRSLCFFFFFLFLFAYDYLGTG